MVERRIWSRRYSTINRFEEQLTASGCAVIKVMLHISPDEQRDRLLERLEDPTKLWKYNPADVDERALWSAYREAYEAARRTMAPHLSANPPAPRYTTAR